MSLRWRTTLANSVMFAEYYLVCRLIIIRTLGLLKGTLFISASDRTGPAETGAGETLSPPTPVVSSCKLLYNGIRWGFPREISKSFPDNLSPSINNLYLQRWYVLYSPLNYITRVSFWAALPFPSDLPPRTTRRWQVPDLRATDRNCGRLFVHLNVSGWIRPN